MHRSESRPAGIVALTMSVFLVALATLLTAHPAAAAPMTYNVTSTACTGTGSITEAMTLANTNPGEDTISFDAGLVVNFASCPPDPAPPNSVDYFALEAEESVIFEGNGAKLQGQMSWITPSGVNNAGQRCPEPGDIVTALTPGVIKVGTTGQDNSAITVTMRELDIDGPSTVALIAENATLVMEDLTVFRIYAAPYNDCSGIAIDAKAGANFVARRTNWADIWNESTALLGTIFRAAIQGNGAGNLTIEDSTFDTIRTAGVIDWNGATGSTANIVTSRFDDAGGIQSSGATAGQIVNSIWASQVLADPQQDERIINSSSEPLKIIASTLLFASDACDPLCQADSIGLPQPRGWVYRNIGAAKIDFEQSAVAVNFPKAASATVYAPLLDPNHIDTGLGFSADVNTWMMQTELQDTLELQAVTDQAALLTDPPASLPTEKAYYQERATPLNGGDLIASIDSAACTQANELTNPIDTSCITTDALGNPRVNGSDERDIGAVQLGLAPHLYVVDIENGKVGVHWTKPLDPGGTITGYQLKYRETGSTTWIPICVDGADTLSYVVTPLVNGTEYEFQVDSWTGGTCPTGTPSGNPSEIVVATPFASIGAPTVTPTPSVCQTHLSWTEVTTDRGPVDYYTVSYRNPPFPFWTLASASTTDLELNVTGLLPGTLYEFAVRGVYNSNDGTAGTEVATTTNGGDIDGSGTVTFGGDRPLFLAANGASTGDANYEPDADLDCDGRVTPADYRLWYKAWIADGRVRNEP